jgi:GR25 family glycosyltransferase involved in LPS biosynthesis
MKFKIIRLKGNSISEKYALECIEQASKFEIDVSYFDAVNGLEYQKHLTQLNINPRYKFKKGKAGVYGCFLSHYYLWKKCIEDNIPYTILEHDGYFIRPLPFDILTQFDDVLKLDNFDPWSKSYENSTAGDGTNNIDVVQYHNPKIKFEEKNQTGNYIRGAYGYIIKPHAAKKLIDWISVNGFVPADCQIGNAIVDIKVVIPTIVRLHPDYQGNIGNLSLTDNPDLL